MYKQLDMAALWALLRTREDNFGFIIRSSALQTDPSESINDILVGISDLLCRRHICRRSAKYSKS